MLGICRLLRFGREPQRTQRTQRTSTALLTICLLALPFLSDAALHSPSNTRCSEAANYIHAFTHLNLKTETPDSDSVQVEPIDLVRRLNAFDDRDPDDWNAPIQVPKGKADWAFSLAELGRHPFAELKGLLGEKAFDALMKKQGFAVPEGEFGGYVGEDDLSLYYYTRDGDKPGTRTLIIVSMGEYQPARIIAHIEGLWRVTGVKF